MESIVSNDELYYFLNVAIYDSSYIALPLLESKPNCSSIIPKKNTD